jgi:hypothetical protein
MQHFLKFFPKIGAQIFQRRIDCRKRRDRIEENILKAGEKILAHLFYLFKKNKIV